MKLIRIRAWISQKKIPLLGCSSGISFSLSPPTGRRYSSCASRDATRRQERRGGAIAIEQPCRRRGGEPYSRSSSSATAGQPIAPLPLAPCSRIRPRVDSWDPIVIPGQLRGSIWMRLMWVLSGFWPVGLILSGLISAGSGRRLWWTSILDFTSNYVAPRVR
jgi:hypothetical protein